MVGRSRAGDARRVPHQRHGPGAPLAGPQPAALPTIGLSRVSQNRLRDCSQVLPETSHAPGPSRARDVVQGAGIFEESHRAGVAGRGRPTSRCRSAARPARPRCRRLALRCFRSAARVRRLWSAERASVFDAVATLKEEELIDQLTERCTIVIVTDNLQQAPAAAFVFDGEIVEPGPPIGVFINPKEELAVREVSERFG